MAVAGWSALEATGQLQQETAAIRLAVDVASVVDMHDVNPIGLVIAGLVVARGRMLTGWARWITLATGGYVFMILFPAVFGPNVAGRLAIGGWMLGWAALGWAVARAELDGGGEQGG
jgi:hypothetical protein